MEKKTNKVTLITEPLTFVKSLRIIIRDKEFFWRLLNVTADFYQRFCISYSGSRHYSRICYFI